MDCREKQASRLFKKAKEASRAYEAKAKEVHGEYYYKN